MKYGICPRCGYKFVICDLNRVDDDTYFCPNCRVHSKLAEIFSFDPL